LSPKGRHARCGIGTSADVPEVLISFLARQTTTWDKEDDHGEKWLLRRYLPAVARPRTWVIDTDGVALSSNAIVRLPTSAPAHTVADGGDDHLERPVVDAGDGASLRR
jgi:hypothetical protein